MKLATNKDLVPLKHGQVIPEKSTCYGQLASGKTGWGTPGSLVGKQWNKYSLKSPSVILVES